MISLPKIPYTHPVYTWFWPTLFESAVHLLASYALLTPGSTRHGYFETIFRKANPRHIAGRQVHNKAFLRLSFFRRIQDTLPQGKFTTRLFWTIFRKANPRHIAGRQVHNKAILRRSFFRQIQDTTPQGKLTTRQCLFTFLQGKSNTHCSKAKSQHGNPYSFLRKAKPRHFAARQLLDSYATSVLRSCCGCTECVHMCYVAAVAVQNVCICVT